MWFGVHDRAESISARRLGAQPSAIWCSRAATAIEGRVFVTTCCPCARPPICPEPITQHRVALLDNCMPLLFSYGTLRDPAVQLRVFGRTLSGTADHLLGFAQTSFEVRDPAFVAANGSRQMIVR